MNGKIQTAFSNLPEEPHVTLCQIDAVDRELIRITQKGLPMVAQPYHVLAEQLHISPDEVIHRMRLLGEHGIIRRIGIIPNHYKLGYTANGMSVWNVPENRIREIGLEIGSLDFVTHCYQRPRFPPEWPYNLFAMVHGRSREEVLKKVETIASLIGDDNRGHQVLFSTRILKKTGLRIT